MSTLSSRLSNIIALCIATLYIIAGQAHFTDRLTPGMAANINEMTPNSHRAFGFLGLDYEVVSIISFI
jgi:hypothetical protein